MDHVRHMPDRFADDPDTVPGFTSPGARLLQEQARKSGNPPIVAVEYPERRHPPINGCTINGYHPCKLGTPAASRPVVPYGGSDPWAGGDLAARIRRAQDRLVDR